MFGPPQSAALTTPQAAPVQVAIAIPANRLKTLDAVFAAGTFAEQARAAGLDGGNLSGDDADAFVPPDGRPRGASN